VVDGTMKVGSIATCAPGSWTGAESFGYRWLRDGVAIPGEKQSTLRLIGQHLDRGIACEVTATNQVGSTTATSTERTVVVGAALVPTSKPEITGKARVGKRLKVSTGTWTPDATAYRITWTVAGRTVGTGSSLKVVRTYRGKVVKAVVTASRSGYEDGTTTVRAKVRKRG
jgi:hypothetical protein